MKISRHNIEEFGKKIRAEQPSFKGSDFSIGCKTAIVDEEDIRNALINKKMFKDKYIIVIPPDEDLSEIEWSKQDHQIRKLFIQHCHAFFTSNKNTIAFVLGEKHPTKKEYLKEFKTFKPCYIGCDARHGLKLIRLFLDCFRHYMNQNFAYVFRPVSPMLRARVISFLQSR